MIPAPGTSSLAVVEPEKVISDNKAVVDGHEMEYLAELQWIALPLSDDVASHEDQDAP